MRKCLWLQILQEEQRTKGHEGQQRVEGKVHIEHCYDEGLGASIILWTGHCIRQSEITINNLLI